MNGHCEDNKSDRELGAYWERQFCTLAASFGKAFTPHQLGKPSSAAAAWSRENGEWQHWTLPDVTIWSAPGEHHEIKHKNPTRDGCYGLEKYRLQALIRFANTTGQQVLYTIHDWQHAGCANSRESVANRIDDWFFADVADLSRSYTRERPGPSYVNGVRQSVPIRYWQVPDYFRPLSQLWGPPIRAFS